MANTITSFDFYLKPPISDTTDLVQWGTLLNNVLATLKFLYSPFQVRLIICLPASFLETVHILKGPIKTENNILGFDWLKIDKLLITRKVCLNMRRVTRKFSCSQFKKDFRFIYFSCFSPHKFKLRSMQ